MIKIVGLRIEKYIDKSVNGSNCDFTYQDAEFTKHILLGLKENNKKIEIELSISEGECGSGWTTASYGNIKIKEVDKFSYSTFIPKEPIFINDITEDMSEISNNVFTYSADGGDEYYPSGDYSVNMDLFIQTKRNSEKRPVWIFMGDSNCGKSFLASKLNESELLIYETDSKNELPETIVENIIVLGNRFKFNIEEVKKRIFEIDKVNIIIVDFKSS